MYCCESKVLNIIVKTVYVYTYLLAVSVTNWSINSNVHRRIGVERCQLHLNNNYLYFLFKTIWKELTWALSDRMNTMKWTTKRWFIPMALDYGFRYLLLLSYYASALFWSNLMSVWNHVLLFGRKWSQIRFKWRFHEKSFLWKKSIKTKNTKKL